MDEVGTTAATRCAGASSVTASVDQVAATRPIPIGQTALIEANVYDAGRTSVHCASEQWRTPRGMSTAGR